ncbi:DUF262 domain-containing protein [Cloacibacillus evryensis]|uniref:DUF262 domain-containing protein n=1 Tax=Cloacibacillus evryensis TaxID=508460 RepID=A0AAW5K681_9BACT|nr:DUF262 domain-containing protein [Cloacibacillus evryensis]MCQ4815361.1 DUF262 domain-containing protein [Cloacibacillus evryensis]
MEWSTSTHPISDIRDWNRANRLELQPDFQRNEVWSKAAQVALIDTILHNIPMPKIYIKAVIREEQTYRVVIDGQQRLTAILAFTENRLKLKTPYISFSEYDGLIFAKLPENTRNRILQYKVDFNEIVNPTDDELRDLYARVNKYTVQLNKQELRRADFPGEFLSLAEKLSDLDFFAENKFFSAGQKRRMLDVEYIEELLALLLEGEQDKKDSLDDFCERYASFQQGINAVLLKFEDVLADISVIFGESFVLLSTRFKQKADFYSLFGCIRDFKNQGKSIMPDSLVRVRESLRNLDKQIAPHAEDETLREYAIHCISDANSASSRRWRKKFLYDYIAPLYISADELKEND